MGPEFRLTPARTKALLDASVDLVFVLDREGVFRDYRAARLEDLSLPPSAFMGKNVSEVLPPDLATQVLHRLHEAIETGEVQVFGYLLHDLAGDPREWEARAAATEDGEVLFISRDVTYGTQAERALRETESKYRTLVEQVPAIVYIVAGDDINTAVYMSPYYERMLGYTPEERLADPELWVRLLHPEDRDRVLAASRRSRSTGEPFAEEYRLFAKDGRVVWVRDEAMLVSDDAGRPMFQQGVMVDITERNRAQEELQASEERFRGAFENAPIGVALVGLDGHFLRVNRALCEMVGRPEHELLVSNFQAITHPEDMEASLEAFRRLVAGDTRTLHMEKRYVRPDDSVVWAQLSVSTVPDRQGQPLYFVGQMLDVTDRKRADQELKQTVEVLRRTDGERRRLLDGVVRATEEERMRIAADLHDGPIQRLTALDYRLESLVARLQPGDPTAPEERLRQVQDGLRREIGGLRTMMIQLRPPALDELGIEAALADHARAVEEQSGVLCTIDTHLVERLDPAQETVLYRVVQEALTNVVKHARAERIWLSLRGDNGSVVLEVRDDGVGFEPAQAGGAAGGTHFGLMTMRERVEMLGGTWSIQTRPGVGTRVRAVVPRRRAGA